MMPALYALVAGSFDLLAGWFTLQGGMAKVQPRYIIAFAAGILLSATFFHILPEINLKTDAPLLALGFATFYLLEKFMMIHACGEPECDTHRIGPIAVLGMALDNITDGGGIAIGFGIRPSLGLAITLAVVFHEIPQGMTSALIMQEAKWSRPRMLLVLALAGLLYPLGALLAGFIPAGLQQKMLAFIAGAFIYIAAGDLLPEAHRRFNWKVVSCVLAGMASMFIFKLLFP
ncbi:MAG: ZIP family metal transporter [Candidatus Omnitrophica bacterium]|nr:ZIP family metal transporter [Candidatus Omnitrophota bacterium]